MDSSPRYEYWRSNCHLINCIEGLETEYGIVSLLDLELTRMLHPNESLKIPSPRSQLIRYAAINELIKKQKTSKDDQSKEKQQEIRGGIKNYEDLLRRLGANKDRLDKLKRDLSNFDQKYSLFDKRVKPSKNGQDTGLSLLDLIPGVENYWQRDLHDALSIYPL